MDPVEGVFSSSKIIYIGEKFSSFINTLDLTKTPVLYIKTHGNLPSDHMNIFYSIVKEFFKISTTKVYIVINATETDTMTISQIETLSTELKHLRPVLEEKLISTFIVLNEDTYWGRGIAETLKAFFKKIYTPVRPIEFLMSDEKVWECIMDYETCIMNST